MTENTNEYRINQLEKMLEQNAQDCFLLHALGLEYWKKNELDKSLHFFARVLENDRNYVGTYYHYAHLLFQTGNLLDAKTIFEQGMEVAQNLKNNHALSELRMAYEELYDE